MRIAKCSSDIRVLIVADLPVVSWPYIIAAEIPIPCCPLDCLPLPKREPYNNLPKTFGTFCSIIPGPLSSIAIFNSDFVYEFNIERFTNDNTIYKIVYNNTPDKFLSEFKSYGFHVDTSNSIWEIK